jgi:transposase-like protein
MKSLDDLTEEILRKLYLEDLLTETQIAEQYGCSQNAIWNRRKKWGVPKVGKTGRITASLEPLTAEQEALLYGSLLGDGHLHATGEEAARFTEGHSEKQVPYLEWKAEILGSYVRKIVETEKRKDEKVYKGKMLYTFGTTHLRPWFDKFYPAPDRKRVFPADLPQRMDPFILAVWYMDDGSILNQFHPRITFGLDDVSLERALAALRVLGFEPTVHPGTSDRTITFPDQDRKFYDLIGPHVPECMKWKVPELSMRRIKDANAKKLTVEIAQQLAADGKSAAEIARMYGVGASTAKRRIAGEERKKMGRPPKKR